MVSVPPRDEQELIKLEFIQFKSWGNWTLDVFLDLAVWDLVAREAFLGGFWRSRDDVDDEDDSMSVGFLNDSESLKLAVDDDEASSNSSSSSSLKLGRWDKSPSKDTVVNLR